MQSWIDQAQLDKARLHQAWLCHELQAQENTQVRNKLIHLAGGTAAFLTGGLSMIGWGGIRLASALAWSSIGIVDVLSLKSIIDINKNHVYNESNWVFQKTQPQNYIKSQELYYKNLLFSIYTIATTAPFYMLTNTHRNIELAKLSQSANQEQLLSLNYKYLFILNTIINIPIVMIMDYEIYNMLFQNH